MEKDIGGGHGSCEKETEKAFHPHPAIISQKMKCADGKWGKNEIHQNFRG